MFEIRREDDESIHDSRQSQPHAMNVRFENVRIEDSLQYHQRRSHRLNEKSDIVQEYSVQHERVSRHDSRIGGGESTHVNERFDFRR